MSDHAVSIPASKKHTVFISSTFKDLRKVRRRLAWACLEGGDIPLGMESFPASSDNAWKVIQRTILESDYYVVIVARRYGDRVPDGRGISFTQREYEFAKENNKPILPFLIHDKVKVEPEHIDTDAKDKEQLDAFKAALRNHTWTTWKSPEDLAAKYQAAMRKAIQTHPMPGWVRSTEAATPETANEIARLSKENEQLRTQLARESSSRKRDSDLAEIAHQLRTIPSDLSPNSATLLDHIVTGKQIGRAHV